MEDVLNVLHVRVHVRIVDPDVMGHPWGHSIPEGLSHSHQGHKWGIEHLDAYHFCEEY